jgi:SAM-dependent methyltransferase
VSRWLEETGGTRGQSYAEAFRALAASGKDVHGEAAYVGALVPPGSRVLDAGCGTGRVAIELARRGYDVVGVDSDPSMLAVARETAPELTWVDGDLATLSLEQRFDLVVAAGNVMVFLAPGTEAEVVARMAAHLTPGGVLVSGWRTERAPDDGRPRLAVATYDAWAHAAGLEPVVRHATWDGDPWVETADWCVAVDRASDAASP